MNFALTEEQKMIQEMCRDFSKTELAPKAARLDETKDRGVLKANVKKMAELGLMGMNIPEAYGGAQVGVVAYSLAMTEIAAGCAATATTMSVTNMVAEILLEFGTDEIKKKHIPRICSGEYTAGAFGLTEPAAVVAKAAGWLRPNGTLSVILQLPSEKSTMVTQTSYESLRSLNSIMNLVKPDVFSTICKSFTLSPEKEEIVTLETGKEFYIGYYKA